MSGSAVCVFCLGRQEGFTSVEHVIPESLGNQELVLPRGVVCDTCNTTRLSYLDGRLCSFAPYSMLRTVQGVKNKRGKHPAFKFAEGSITYTDGTIHVEENEHAPPGTFTHRQHGDGGALHLNMSGGPRLTDRLVADMAACLLKMALEAIYLDHGERALAREFDHIRDRVLTGGQAGFLLLQTRNSEPTATSTLAYNIAGAGDTTSVQVLFDYFGWQVATDSRRDGPASTPPNFICRRFGSTSVQDPPST